MLICSAQYIGSDSNIQPIVTTQKQLISESGAAATGRRTSDSPAASTESRVKPPPSPFHWQVTKRCEVSFQSVDAQIIKAVDAGKLMSYIYVIY